MSAALSSAACDAPRRLLLALLAATCLADTPAARAQSEASDMSALSLLPVAVSVVAPALVLSTGVMLTVKTVEVSARGSVWILERASDGARVSIRFAGQASAAVGTAVAVTAISAGWLLSAAGVALAFVPSEIGRALLHDERITR